MAECEHFRDEVKDIPSNEIRRDRQRQFSTAHITWCAHPKHSPVTRDIARSPGGRQRLKCEGLLGKCPLSSEQFQDV